MLGAQYNSWREGDEKDNVFERWKIQRLETKIEISFVKSYRTSPKSWSLTDN
jgi:hypothetical protein